MAKDRKIKLGVYTAWNYEKEIEDLNKASEQGWQLVRGGCFHSVFARKPELRYRYQLDYRRIDDMARYIETFREQGWEYVNSTFNGWHYFRKLYDPELPEEAYEIFTDRESLREMNSRWARVSLVIGIIIGLFALFYLVREIRKPELPTLVILLTYAIESVVLLRGAFIMRDPDASRNRRGDSAFFIVFIAVILLGMTAMITLTNHRPRLSTEQIAADIDEPIEDSRWADFEVRYADNYYLDLDLEAEEPMTFSVLDENGEAVYSETGTDFHGEDIRLWLPRGHYCFSMTCSTGFDISCSID